MATAFGGPVDFHQLHEIRYSIDFPPRDLGPSLGSSADWSIRLHDPDDPRLSPAAWGDLTEFPFRNNRPRDYGTLIIQFKSAEAAQKIPRGDLGRLDFACGEFVSDNFRSVVRPFLCGAEPGEGDTVVFRLAEEIRVGAALR